MRRFVLESVDKQIPALGFGLWQVSPKDAVRLVNIATSVGYRHFDCSPIFMTERDLGSQIFSNFSNRKELFIASKLWGNAHLPELVRGAFEKTLKNLDCEYMDLYMLHTPCRVKHILPTKFVMLPFNAEWLLETWEEMQNLVKRGYCKSIGVSNFTTKALDVIVKNSSIKPAVNQVEMHPYLRQEKLKKYCCDNDIHITAFSPLGSPGTRTTSLGKPNSPILIQDYVITTIAHEKGVSPAQVLIAWGLTRNTSLLVKASSESRIKENMDAMNVKLSEEEINRINNIDIKERYIDYSLFIPEDQTLEEYWTGEYFN